MLKATVVTYVDLPFFHTMDQVVDHMESSHITEALYKRPFGYHLDIHQKNDLRRRGYEAVPYPKNDHYLILKKIG